MAQQLPEPAIEARLHSMEVYARIDCSVNRKTKKYERSGEKPKTTQKGREIASVACSRVSLQKKKKKDIRWISAARSWSTREHPAHSGCALT